ncbi:(2Fe-2S)-binding protein [Thermodesulfobacteriota bacterium]
MEMLIKMEVNGENYSLDVEPNETLLDVLRKRLELTGTKKGCDTGDCGACTVLINNRPVVSCLTLAVDTDRKQIRTIEGMANKEDGSLHPIQKAFVENGAIQCGYCTSGMVLSAKALLDENPEPKMEDIKKAISGNLCRCTGYVKILKAIEAAS